MTVQICKSYGVLSHEKKPFYSVYTPASDIYEKINVEIPYPIWHNYLDEIGVTLDGEDFLLSQVLTNWGDAPAMVWVSRNNVKRHIILEVVPA